MLHVCTPCTVRHASIFLKSTNMRHRQRFFLSCSLCRLPIKKKKLKVAGLKANKGLYGIIERLRQTAALAALS